MKDADGNYRLLTTAERAEERRELAFQRQVNGNHYVTWNRLLRRVDPERRYRVLRFGTAEAMQGEELLARAHTSQSISDCTMVTGISQVADDYVLPVRDMWETIRDPRTRRVMVTNHLEDVWDITRFTEPVSPEEMPPDVGKVREAARTMADGKLRDLPSGDREAAEGRGGCGERLHPVRGPAARAGTALGGRPLDRLGQGPGGLRPGLRPGPDEKSRSRHRPTTPVAELPGLLRTGRTAALARGDGRPHDPELREVAAPTGGRGNVRQRRPAQGAGPTPAPATRKQHRTSGDRPRLGVAPPTRGQRERTLRRNPGETPEGAEHGHATGQHENHHQPASGSRPSP